MLRVSLPIFIFMGSSLTISHPEWVWNEGCFRGPFGDDITRARLTDRDITDQDLVITAVSIVPLSRTMKEQINHIREWAFERAVRATPRAMG